MPAALRFVIVRLGGQDYAVPAARVAGMIQLRGLDLQPVENCGPIRFRATIHGRLLPILVPHRWLGLQDQPLPPRSCLLLVRNGAPGLPPPSDAQFGIAVDSISRIEDVPPAFYRSSGHVRIGEKWRAVLDIDRLCRIPAHASRNFTTN